MILERIKGFPTIYHMRAMFQFFKSFGGNKTNSAITTFSIKALNCLCMNSTCCIGVASCIYTASRIRVSLLSKCNKHSQKMMPNFKQYTTYYICMLPVSTFKSIEINYIYFFEIGQRPRSSGKYGDTFQVRFFIDFLL